MDNEILKKRGLILLLVIITFVVFIGLVWIIAVIPDRNLLAKPDPSNSIAEWRSERNCTYPIAYWKEHPELYPPGIIMGAIKYQAADIQQVLDNAETGFLEKLQAQLLVAYMNTLSGSEQTMIETAIFQAYEWLVQHPLGSQISDRELELGSQLIAILEAYNLGLAGVASCPDWIMPAGSESPAAVWTATASNTPSPSQTISATPSETPTQTLQPTFPVWTAIQPSVTRTPTTEAPNNPPATQAPPPAPTNTVAPPTQAPPPTETKSPPTSTLPPEPTSTLPPPP